MKQNTMTLRDHGFDTSELRTTMSDTVDILTDDGRTLFTLRLSEFGGLEITSGSNCRHADINLSEKMTILPKDYRRIVLVREPDFDN